VAIPTIKPFTTKQEADNYARLLNKVREQQVSQLRAIDRKRSWSPAQKAMAKADATMIHKAVSELREAICMAHGIGGY